jgi:hypothetical protein
MLDSHDTCSEWSRLRLTGVMRLCSLSVETFALNAACEPILTRLPVVFMTFIRMYVGSASKKT